MLSLQTAVLSAVRSTTRRRDGEEGRDVAGRMHDDEVEIDADLVRRLLTGQHPQWADLPIERVESTGTVNAIFRVGDDVAVRLPRTPRWHDLDAELCWLGSLAGLLPISIPEAVARGEPSDGYRWPWAVVRWIDGQSWTLADIADPCAAASEVAGFLRTLQRLDPDATRCLPPEPVASLRANDASVRASITAAAEMVETERLLTAWAESIEVPDWSGPPVLLHGDLLAGNVLVRDGRVCAVIDWGGVRCGDPARDLMAAWTLFTGDARRHFRAAMGFDDDTWARARGWALTRIANVAYYAVTNPSFSADARVTITEALNDSM